MNHFKNYLTVQTIIAVTFAIALQIQITILSSEDYIGLRVNLADFLLPMVGFYILVTLVFKKSIWPKWHMKRMELWSLALICVFTIALANGYVQNGFLSKWALINKYIGFLILISYMWAGAWVVNNFQIRKDKTQSDEPLPIQDIFIISFLSFSALLLYCSSFVTLFPIAKFASLGDYPWDALMANRNAYMLSIMFSLVFVLFYKPNSFIKTFEVLKIAILFIMPYFAIMNASRTGWILITLITILTVIWKPMKTVKYTLPIIMFGAIFTYTIYHATDTGSLVQKQIRTFKEAVYHDETKPMYEGDEFRLIAIEDGLEFYKKSNPVSGLGLGRYKEMQIEKRGEYINVIDFTSLWILVEMGILGLVVFSAFFVMCLYVLFKTSSFSNRNKNDNSATSFNTVFFIYLIYFFGASILHEIMYTRFVWFALGIAIAVPQSIKKSE